MSETTENRMPFEAAAQVLWDIVELPRLDQAWTPELTAVMETQFNGLHTGWTRNEIYVETLRRFDERPIE